MPVPTDEALADACGSAIVARVFEDPSSGDVIATARDSKVRWFRRGRVRTDVDLVAEPRSSFHYPDRSLVAVKDVKRFVGDAARIDERVMQWTAGDSKALYREAVRLGGRVLLVWGLNNARDLQSVGVTTGVQDALALVTAFRVRPPKGFKTSSPYFLGTRGGIAREYTGAHAPPELVRVVRPGATITSARAQCVDNIVRWYVDHTDRHRDSLVEELADDASAERRFDALELAWYRAGGAPYEIEWMKTIRRRADHTLLEWIRWYAGETGTFHETTRRLLAAAGIELPELSAVEDEVVNAVARIPAVHWLRVGERAGALQHRTGDKPGIERWWDEGNHVVATVTRDRSGGIAKVKVTRAKTADAARALWETP